MAPYDPPIAHYAQLDVSQYPLELLLAVIGKGGQGFYRITDRLNLEYVWYDIDRKIVELWGSYSALKHGAADKLNKILKNAWEKRGNNGDA